MAETLYPGNKVRLDIQVYLSQLEAEANHLLDQMETEVLRRVRRGIPQKNALASVLGDLDKGEGIAKAWSNRQNRLIAGLDKEMVARPVHHEAEDNPHQKYAWVLGAVKTSHCGDCLSLSQMEPKTYAGWRAQGFGLPRDGDTECNVGCQCMLVKAESGTKEPKEKIKKLDPIKVAAQVQKDILDESKNRFEIAAAFDKDGRMLIKKKGKVDRVDFTQAEAEMFRGAEIFTHNHPSSSSFSDADIFTTIFQKIKEMRAIAPESHRGHGYYYIRPTIPPEIETGNQVDRFVGRLKNEISVLNMEKQAEFWALVNSGKLSGKLADLRHWDEIWETIAKRHGWEYGFRKD